MKLFRTRIHSYVPCVAAIFEHCCLRSPLGYPILANSASFCTALWCNVSASLAMRCTLSVGPSYVLRTARRCSNDVALSNRWYRHILCGCSNVLSFLSQNRNLLSSILNVLSRKVRVLLFAFSKRRVVVVCGEW